MLDFLLGFITTPTIVLALVAAAGMVMQKKSVSEVFSGAVKTAVGLIILNAGCSFLSQQIDPFISMFVEIFDLKGVLPLDMAVVGLLQSSSAVIGRVSAIIMVVGFAGNILLARVTPLKYIFLTGQLTWAMSIVFAHALIEAGLNETMAIIVGSAALALVLSITPAVAQPIMRKLTGNNDTALGHFTTISLVGAAWIGALVGNPKKNAEDMKVPESISFFKETAISVSIIMTIFFTMIVLMAGPEAVAQYAGEQNYIVYAIIGAFSVAGGILTLLYGVNTFLDALIPAFKGISEKCVPGAIPALDIPAFMGASPNALLIGFVCAIPGMIAGMLICGPVFGIVPIIAVDAAFFNGGMAGILGNAIGGFRGSVAAGLVQGFLTPFSVGLTYELLNYGAYGVEGLAISVSDPIIGALLLRSPWIGLAVLAAVFVVLCVLELKRQKKNA